MRNRWLNRSTSGSRSIQAGFAVIILIAALSVYLELTNTKRIRDTVEVGTQATVDQAVGAASMSRDIRQLRAYLESLLAAAKDQALAGHATESTTRRAVVAGKRMSETLEELRSDIKFTRRHLAAESPNAESADTRENEALLRVTSFYVDRLSKAVIPLTQLSNKDLLRTSAYLHDVVEPSLERVTRLIDDLARRSARELKTGTIQRIGHALNDVNHVAIISAIAVAGTALLLGALVTHGRNRAEKLIRTSERKFRALVQHASDVITVISPDGTVVYVSPAVHSVLGIQPDELVGTNSFELVHPEDASDVGTRLEWLLSAPGASTSMEVRLRHRDRSWRCVEAVGTNLVDDSAVGGVVVNYHDITQRKALEGELTRQAFHDSLTGLANRALFRDRLEHSLALRRRDQLLTAVALLDLDDFKSVNDGLGHAAGDDLLVALGRRIQTLIRASDTAARLGGDEFAVVLDGMTREDEAVGAAQRMMELFEEPFDVEGRQLILSGSIGIALAPSSATAAELLRDADVAMYKAKAEGKNRFVVYESGMYMAAVERLELKGRLESALERNEFSLHYQPIIALRPGRVIGSEALLRWSHPERGFVPPAEFIPLAEETGFIIKLGRWVLREACRQTMEWQRTYGLQTQLMIAVNLSARQLDHPRIVDDVSKVLGETGLPAEALTIEITESLLIKEPDAVAVKLGELKALGLQLAIDDFGTGYSSLSYLQRFPIDHLKIDKRFVDGVEQGVESSALAHAVIRVGESLSAATVAEGIESPGQVKQLVSLGCDLGQGFHFSRPLPPDAFAMLLADASRQTERPSRDVSTKPA